MVDSSRAASQNRCDRFRRHSKKAFPPAESDSALQGHAGNRRAKDCHARVEDSHARAKVFRVKMKVCGWRVEVSPARWEGSPARVKVCRVRAKVCPSCLRLANKRGNSSFFPRPPPRDRRPPANSRRLLPAARRPKSRERRNAAHESGKFLYKPQATSGARLGPTTAPRRAAALRRLTRAARRSKLGLAVVACQLSEGEIRFGIRLPLRHRRRPWIVLQ